MREGHFDPRRWDAESDGPGDDSDDTPEDVSEKEWEAMLGEPDASIDDDDEETGERQRPKLFLISMLVGVVVVVAACSSAATRSSNSCPSAKNFTSRSVWADEDIGAGLRIEGLRMSRKSESGIDRLLVQGQLVHTTDVIRPVPHLRLTLLSAAGQALRTIDVKPSKKPAHGRRDDQFRSLRHEPAGGGTVHQRHLRRNRPDQRAPVAAPPSRPKWSKSSESRSFE